METQRPSYLKKKVLLFVLLAFLIIIPVLWMLKQNERGPQDFSLTDLNGNTFRLSDFKGKIVVVEFMATWCIYCRQQISYYEEVWKEYADKAVLIIIDIDASEPEHLLREFADHFSHPDWIWAKDTANLVKSYTVTGIPKTIIFDQNGYVRYSHTGLMSPSAFKEMINQLLD